MERSGYKNPGLTGVVINYYNPTGNIALYYQTLLCASSYLESKECIVCLSDGSGFKDDKLSKEADDFNLVYLHSSRKLSFAEGYNQGINYFKDISDVGYIILSANDIVATKDCIEQLRDCFETSLHPGCIIPYLTYSDYFLQNAKFSYKKRIVPVMTLNCNFFLKEDLLKMNLVPEYLSGYFNDVVMSAELFKMGKQIYLAKGLVASHLASRTVAVSSSANYATDKKVFMERHGNLSYKGGFNIKANKFTHAPFERFFSFLTGMISSSFYQAFISSIYKSVFQVEFFFYSKIFSSVPLSARKWIKNLYRP